MMTLSGLCIQADSFDELIDIAKQLEPELLEFNVAKVAANLAREVAE